MLTLLLVYSLTQGSLGNASPISSTVNNPHADVSSNNPNNYRTISSIVWSCFSTIFLCTWVSLHPNISITRDTRGMGGFEKSVVHPLRGFMKNKLPLLLWALIAPEYILAWAIRQYLKAGNIKQNVPGWTRTHGFFVLMGGFHLYRLPNDALSKSYPPEFALPTDFVIVQSLSSHSYEEEVPEHPLDATDLSVRSLAYLSPSETEIKDKSKADVLAKVLALIQTLWFVAQCIARGVKHLPLTEIEVVTLAYTTVNVFIYYFWWDKPKDVECPVRVYKTLKAGQVKKRGKAKWPVSGAWEIIEWINGYIGGTHDPCFRLSEETQVPMFWSGNGDFEISARATLGASIIGTAFGATHFIAWNSEFPSHIERLLWWISCIAMTAELLILAVSYGLTLLHMYAEKRTEKQIALEDNRCMRIMTFVSRSYVPLAPLLYLFTRIATLVIAFTTLRELPVDAFKTVDWTTFISHL